MTVTHSDRRSVQLPEYVCCEYPALLVLARLKCGVAFLHSAALPPSGRSKAVWVTHCYLGFPVFFGFWETPEFYPHGQIERGGED